jgi:hypothetical protein
VRQVIKRGVSRWVDQIFSRELLVRHDSEDGIRDRTVRVHIERFQQDDETDGDTCGDIVPAPIALAIDYRIDGGHRCTAVDLTADDARQLAEILTAAAWTHDRAWTDGWGFESTGCTVPST